MAGYEYLHLLTSGSSPARRWALRVDLADFEGETRYAEYSDFAMASAADFYRLSLTGYHGDAGQLLI